MKEETDPVTWQRKKKKSWYKTIGTVRIVLSIYGNNFV